MDNISWSNMAVLFKSRKKKVRMRQEKYIIKIMQIFPNLMENINDNLRKWDTMKYKYQKPAPGHIMKDC